MFSGMNDIIFTGSQELWNLEFRKVFKDVDDFINDFRGSPFYMERYAGIFTDEHLNLIYSLVFAKYKSSTINDTDLPGWKLKFHSHIFQNSIQYLKTLEVQEKVIGLTEDDILKNGEVINNSSENPSTLPSTGTMEHVETVNHQDVSISKNSKIEAYNGLLITINDMLGNFSREFINSFSVLFSRIPISLNELKYKK